MARSGRDTRAIENYQTYRYCYDNGHSEWVELAHLCLNFWRGKQWRDADIMALIASRRPHLTFNVIESLIRTMKGIQRALRNDVRFMPTEDANLEDAQVRDAIWLNIQNQNQLDFMETDLYERGLVMGRAYYKLSMELDDNTQGQIKLATVRSQDVVLDPCIQSYEPKGWPQVFHCPWYNLQEIEHEFGKHVAKELKDIGAPDWYGVEDRLMAQKVGQLPYYQFQGFADEKLIRAYRLMIRQYTVNKKVDVFIDTETGETMGIPDSWERERVQQVMDIHPTVTTTKRNRPTIKVMTTCENVVIQDAIDSPFRDYDIVPYFPTFMDGITMGATESLVGPQELYNKVTSQELHHLNSSANSGYKFKTGTLVGMTREQLEQQGARPGFVAELTQMDGLEKFTPNPLPQGHDRMSFKADKIMRSLSGVSDQSRGFAREDVANEAIMSNQAASDLNFASWLSNLHRSKQLLANVAMNAATDYYSETRVIQINKGSAFKPTMQQYTINQQTPEGDVINDITKGKFTSVTVPSPTRSTMTEDEFKQMVMLKKELGIQIPDSLMIELSNAPNKMQIIQSLTGDSNDAMKQKQQQEAEQARQEAALSAAKVTKEQSAAQLNAARAAHFQDQIGKDPDAAYREVEMARIESDQHEADRRITFDYDKLKVEREKNQHNTALDLTKLDHEKRENEKDRKVDVAKVHMQGVQRKQLSNAKGAQK